MRFRPRELFALAPMKRKCSTRFVMTTWLRIKRPTPTCSSWSTNCELRSPPAGPRPEASTQIRAPNPLSKRSSVLGRGVGAPLLAEGVETDDQLEFLVAGRLPRSARLKAAVGVEGHASASTSSGETEEIDFGPLTSSIDDPTLPSDKVADVNRHYVITFAPRRELCPETCRTIADWASVCRPSKHCFLRGRT